MTQMTVWLELITQDKDDKRDEEEATAFDWLLCFIVNICVSCSICFIHICCDCVRLLLWDHWVSVINEILEFSWDFLLKQRSNKNKK